MIDQVYVVVLRVDTLAVKTAHALATEVGKQDGSLSTVVNSRVNQEGSYLMIFTDRGHYEAFLAHDTVQPVSAQSYPASSVHYLVSEHEKLQ